MIGFVRMSALALIFGFLVGVTQAQSTTSGPCTERHKPSEAKAIVELPPCDSLTALNQIRVEFEGLNTTFKNDPANESEGIVDFSIELEEGKQFKLHSISFEDENLSQKQMNDFFVLRVGDVFMSDSWKKVLHA